MIPKDFKKISINNKEYDFVDISKIKDIDKVPYTYRILIENIIRQNWFKSIFNCFFNQTLIFSIK